MPRDGQALPWQTAPVDIDVVGPLARSTDTVELDLLGRQRALGVPGHHPVDDVGVVHPHPDLRLNIGNGGLHSREANRGTNLLARDPASERSVAEE